MNNTKILIIEDSAADAELARRQIDRELGLCRYHVVDTYPDFMKAMEEFKPDLIISDYMLPNFDGMTALKSAVKKLPDIPFLIFTGSMNEDTAIACMKAGACDYIIKEHIKRLGPAVRSALQEKDTRFAKRRTEEALFRAGKEWRATFDAMKDALFVTNTNGSIIRANNAFRRMTDKPWPEIIGKFCGDVFSDEENKGDICPGLAVLKDEKHKESEVIIQQNWYRSVVDPIFDNEGEVLEVIHILTDT